METVNEGTGGTVGISPPVRRMLVSVLFVCLFVFGAGSGDGN